jgi:2-keto-4-pentenoate hydratase/2-oxohepta-3-ene-1,7-dioic acid hydratase in catechol pathway
VQLIASRIDNTMAQKTIRFYHQSKSETGYADLVDNKVEVLSDAPWSGGDKTGTTYDLADVKVLAPVEPSKIVCVGLNYHAHVSASHSADEAPEEPLLFFKPPSSVVAPGDEIICPPQAERVDYEAELGVVIGKTACKVPADGAEDYIYGYTCVNDVTARDLQKKDKQWARAKGFDTFCPIGPWVVDELNWSDVLVEGIHNGEIKQSGRTSLMIFPIPFLISYISAAMTLYPGDVISTGTPAGIAPMIPGDTILVRVEGIGTLENVVA